MNEESKLARGALALSVAGILSKVISIAYSPLLRSILGYDGMGVYGRVLDVFLFIYALTSVGAQPAVAKVVSELTALGNNKGAIRALKISRKFYFWTGTVAGLVMIGLAYPISKMMNSSDVVYGIMALAPCIVITCLLSVYRGYLQGKGNMTPIAVSQILEQFLNVAISLLCAYILMNFSLELGVAGAQIGTSIGALFALFYCIYGYYKRKYAEEALADTHHPSDKKIYRKMMMYSIPIILSSGLQNFGGLVDSANVSTILQNIGFAKKEADSLYGIYTIYKTIIGVPLVLITAIATTVLPLISKARALKDNKSVRSGIRNAFKLALSVAIPSAFGLSVLSEPIYRAIYDNDYGSFMMKVGSFIIIIMTITQIQSVILQSINKFYYVLLTFAIGIICKIALNYFMVGIYELNIYGVLIGNTVWHLIPAIMNHKKICKTMRMKMPVIRLVFKPLVSSIIMVAAIMIAKMPFNFMYRFINPTRLNSIPVVIVLVLVGAIVYLYIMILIGGIKKSDIELVSPRIIAIMPKFMRKKLK